MAGSFSFDTPEEVMHVLASVRASGVDAAQKNQIRDLVLSYTNGGKDPSLKIQIAQQLTQLGIAPNAAPTTLSTEEALGFGSSRNVPSFFAASPPTQTQAPVVTPAPVPTQPAQAVPPAAPAPASPVAPQVPSQPQPPAPMNRPQVAPVAPSAPAPTPTPTPTAPATPNVLQRIREIKSLVNEKVGNPVNLVDIDNAVGREYMSALLDAMKKLNSGGDISAAMNRLETAYTSVESVLETFETAKSAPPPAAQPSTPPAPAETAAAAVSVPIRSSAPMPEHVAHGSDDSAARWANKQIRVPDFVAPVQPATRPATAPPAPTPAESNSTPAPDLAPTPAEPEPPKRTLVINAVPQATPEVDLAPKEKTAAVAQSPDTLVKPLSKTGTPLKSVDDLPTPDSLETSSKNGDPLYTKEVDDGLNQLLSDWVLFKKSGLFGSGPKGLEHPLYIKIKELQIPILLAGRFEGATQEIKQSITDYMNGWRYEQGIIYEQGETFEHYLRRVIRHIIDLQK